MLERALKELFVPTALASTSSGAPKILEELKKTAEKVGYETAPDKNLFFFIEQLIKVGLSLIGVVFLAMMLYAGFTWMTAMGEKEKITRARDTIIYATIGVIVTISAYAITKFVFESFGKNIIK